MVKEAESHAADDRRRREEVEARNAADAAIFTAEKALREGGDKVPADVRRSVEDKVAAVRKTLEGSDLNAITQATNELYQVIQSVGASMYQQPGAGPEMGGQPGADGGGQEPGSPGQKPGGDDVVEGEFKEA
jgi:molecular chaperone DnaK